MKNSFRSVRLLAAFCLGFFSLLPAFGQAGLLISQIYGGGGNGSASYNADFIELYNPTSAAISTSGLSVQYASAAGNFTQALSLTTATIQPHTYFLVQTIPAGTVGVSLPTPDTTGTAPNLSATAGKVALVNGTVALSGDTTCALILADTKILDLVGYGTTASCYRGAGPAPTTPNNATSIIRTVSGTNTNSNSADFSTSSPITPRNSSVGGGITTQSLALTANANPSAVGIGSVTLLTATVTPASNPASTGIAVSVDLSAIGGSQTQPLYDDGTHGDTTASDNVFSYSATVGGTATGSMTLNFKANDSQLNSATATASLSVQAPAGVVAIHSIQAGAPASAYLGQTVTTTGIVVGIRNSGFYLEAADSQQDADRTTSEGIFVVSSGNSSVVLGSELKVTGTVQLSSTTALTPATELGGTVTLSVLSTGNALPTPIALALADDSPAGGLSQFLKFQGMRFSVASFTPSAPTGGTLSESAETYVSNGEFYGVVTGVARPFVEPGLSVLETTLPSGPTYCTATVTTNCVARFDANPELMRIESTPFGGTALNVTANQIITNMLGVVDFTFNDAEFVLDPTAPGTLGAPMTYIPVPVAAANEFTVGSMNLERFYSNIPATGAVTLTTEAYTRRLAKASLVLRKVQLMPDIIGIQEMGTLATLNDLAAKISLDAVADGKPDPKYSTCLFTGNDTSGINTAFLVKTTRVTVTDCTQFGKATTFQNSVGAQATLNDRPPLVLHAVVNATGYAAFPVTVISNHLRSLNGEDDTTTTGQTVRLKREIQAEYLAALIQGYQANGEQVVSVGDYNAFPFNDGYSDSLGVIKGTPPAAATVVNGTTSSYVPPSPVLTDLDTLITDQTQRYDYSFVGNVQVLDHVVVTQGLLPGVHIAYSHEDADFPLIQYNDATTPQSTSDHDGAVAFFPLLVPAQNVKLTPATQDFGSVTVGSPSAGIALTLTNSGTTAISISSVAATGDFTETSGCGTSLAGNASCTITAVFTPTVAGPRTGVLTVTTPLGALSSTLTGTGLAPAATGLTPASQDFGTVAAGTASAVKVFTFANTGGTTSTITSITATGDFSKTAATTCGTSLTPGATCNISVVFTPGATGARTGSLTVVATGSANALVSTLTGTGAAQATLAPGSATYASTGIGKTSAAQAFTLANTAGVAIPIGTGTIALTGDYTQTNNCGTSLAAAATCTINVSFVPTAVGTRAGTLTVTPVVGGVSTPVTASLSGTGFVVPDFGFSGSSTSGTVTAGSTATTSFTLTAVGSYTGAMTVTCTGAAANTVCSPSPSSFTLSSTPTTINVSIATQTVKSAGYSSWMLAALVSLVVMGVYFARRRGVVRTVGLLSVLLIVSLFGAGCGGSATATAPTTVTTKATPGTYTYTIVASDGTLTHTINYVLTVQ